MAGLVMHIRTEDLMCRKCCRLLVCKAVGSSFTSPPAQPVLSVPHLSHVFVQTMSCPVLQKEESNPLKQDIKKEKLRFYPYNIHWNYGMLPQTWEDPEHKSEELGGIAVCTLHMIRLAHADAHHSVLTCPFVYGEPGVQSDTTSCYLLCIHSLMLFATSDLWLITLQTRLVPVCLKPQTCTVQAWH